LQFHWFHYAEAGATEASLAALTIAQPETARAIITPTAVSRSQWLTLPGPKPKLGIAHIILAVTDNG